MSAQLKSPHTEAKVGYIAGLDGLRALAIFGVLLAHGFESGDGKLAGVSKLFVSSVGHIGTAGVKLFFAISGYLICTRLANELKSSNPIVALKAFYIRRFFRILPPVLPYLICLEILNKLSSIRVSLGEIIAALLFYSNYWPTRSWFTLHFWSLSVEEHFYLLWAPLLAFAGRKRAALTAVTVIVLTAFFRPIIILDPSDPSHLLGKTHLQLDSFMFPCLLALGLLTPVGRKSLAAVANTSWFLVFGAALAVLPLLIDHLHTRIDTRVLQSLLFALIAIIPGLNSSALVTRLLELPVLKWIGHRSYSIYIWQMLLFVPSDSVLSDKLYRFVIHCILILPIAELSFRFVEQPLIKIGRSIAADAKHISSSTPAPLTSLSH